MLIFYVITEKEKVTSVELEEAAELSWDLALTSDGSAAQQAASKALNDLYSTTIPIVIIDALSSDDRFNSTEIIAEVRKNAPDKTALSDYQIFSCEYTAQFEHVGVPMGQSIKTNFREL